MRLGLVLAFLFLFLRQRFLLLRVFLLQLLGMVLVLLLDLLFFTLIRGLLRRFGLLLFLPLLNFQPLLPLLGAELILFLLMLPIQLGIR